MPEEMSGAISPLPNLLLKFMNTGEDKKSDSFFDMQTEISALFYNYACMIKFLIIVRKCLKQMIHGNFGISLQMTLCRHTFCCGMT